MNNQSQHPDTSPVVSDDGLSVVPDYAEQRRQAEQYLDLIFGDRQGRLHYAFGVGPSMNGKYEHEDWQDKGGAWPDCRERFLEEALRRAATDDVYVCPHLGTTVRRLKESAAPSAVLHADDGDASDPRLMVVDSGGGGKPHVYARLAEPLEVSELNEALGRMRSYVGGDAKIRDNDVLRLPGTINHKLGKPVRLLREGEAVALEEWGLPQASRDESKPAPTAVDAAAGIVPESLPDFLGILTSWPADDRSLRFKEIADECIREGLDDAAALAVLLDFEPAADKYKTRHEERAREELARARMEAAPSPPLTITVTDIRDFIAVDEPGAEAVLGTDEEAVLVIAEEYAEAMLYGLPGANKTAMANDLAFSLASGQPWLGIPTPKRRRVLLIENEGPRGLYRRQLAKKYATRFFVPDPGYLHVWTDPWARIQVDDRRWQKELAKVIAANGIEYVIIGPVSGIGFGENGTLKEVGDFMDHFREIRSLAETRTGFLLIHHENRAGNVSGVFEGKVETLLHAKRRGHGRAHLAFEKARWSSEWHGRSLDLLWSEDEAFGFEVVEKREEHITEEEMDAAIFAAIADAPGTGWKAIETGVELGKRNERVAARDRLFVAGRIVNRVKQDGAEVLIADVLASKRASLYVAGAPEIAHLQGVS